jgi:hypothetical protein
MIAFSCPGCGKSYSVKDEFAGRKTRYPKCGASIALPVIAAPLCPTTPNTTASQPRALVTPPSLVRSAQAPTGYVESNLLSGERVVARAVLHWARYIPGIILLPLLGVGLIVFLVEWINGISTELAVTNKRVIAKRGLVSRQTLELNLAKVETIAVDQTIFGRLLGYGTVTVIGTGGTEETFKFIEDPLAFRKAVQSQSH